MNTPNELLTEITQVFHRVNGDSINRKVLDGRRGDSYTFDLLSFLLKAESEHDLPLTLAWMYQDIPDINQLVNPAGLGFPNQGRETAGNLFFPMVDGGVPMAMGSKMMGHKDIRKTQGH